MRKIICLLLATCLVVMSGCSSTSMPGSTLTGKGLELIGKVDKLAECEEYIRLYTLDAEINKVIKAIAENDYTKPKNVFKIENLGAMVLENMLSETKLPEDIAKTVEGKFETAIPTQITAMNGTTALAAISILNYGESFIYKNLKSSATYLYTYENGYGFMVNYNPNDENIVIASVAVVINDELSKCSSEEEVIDFFRDTFQYEGLAVSIVTE